MAIIYNVLAGCLTAIVIGLIVYLYTEELRMLQAHNGTVNNITAIAHMIADLLDSDSGADNIKVIQTVAKTAFSNSWITIYDTAENGKVLMDGSMASDRGGGWQGQAGTAPDADQREALDAILAAEKESNIKGIATARRTGRAPNGSLRTITMSAARPSETSSLVIIVQAL